MGAFWFPGVFVCLCGLALVWFIAVLVSCLFVLPSPQVIILLLPGTPAYFKQTKKKRYNQDVINLVESLLLDSK